LEENNHTPIEITKRRPVWKKLLHITGLLANQLTTVPLFVVTFAALIHLPFGWRSIVLLLMSILATWGIMVITSNRDINSSFDDFFVFAEEFEHLTLTPIPMSDYLAAIQAHNKEPLLPSPGSNRKQEVLPLSARIREDTIRVIVATCGKDQGPCPAQYLCYASGVGAWIIIPDFPDQLTSLQHLIVLHEIGHASFGAFDYRRQINTNWQLLAWSALIIALQTRPSYTNMLVIVLLTIVWIFIARINLNSLKSIERHYDEITADIYALARCDPKWFKKYIQSARKVAETICKAESKDDPILTQHYFHRVEIFTENFKRMIDGRPLQTLRELLRSPKFLWLENVLLITVLTICGLSYAPLTIWRLATISFITLLIFILAILVMFIQLLQAAYVDDRLGIKPMDPRLYDVLLQGGRIRNRLKNSIFKRLFSSSKYQ
jgi:hypothetical protein